MFTTFNKIICRIESGSLDEWEKQIIQPQHVDRNNGWDD